MNKRTQKLTLAAVFIAVGMVLPFLTMQMKEIGDTLLPMHLPIMLCGIFCGWKYGLICGILLPILRSLCFGMPPIYPNALWMSAELATYGCVIALCYNNLFRKKFLWIYPSLIIAMLAGRFVWAIAKTILLGVAGKSFTLAMFITGGFTDAFPGILLQLVLIPFITKLSDRSKKND